MCRASRVSSGIRLQQKACALGRRGTRRRRKVHVLSRYICLHRKGRSYEMRPHSRARGRKLPPRAAGPRLRGRDQLSTPCRAFGHTAGRYPSGGCRACIALHASIHSSMLYWYRRMILGRPSMESHAHDPAMSRAAHRGYSIRRYKEDPVFRQNRHRCVKLWKRAKAAKRDQAALNSLLEAHPWLRKLK